MSLQKTGKSFAASPILPIALLALSVLVIAFFTYDAYYLLTAKREELAQVRLENSNLGKTLADLGNLKTQASTPAFADEISRYAAPYGEDAILESLFLKDLGIAVFSVGMDRGEKLPNGLSMANVTLSFRASSQASLLKYLEGLTGTSGKKRYVVRQASFPFNSAASALEPVQASVSLGMYFYSK